MNAESNPYHPPSALDAPTEHAPRRRLSLGRLLVGFLLFSIVSTGCWIGLILLWLPDTSDYWPGFACAVPAVAAGAITFRAVLGGTTLGRLLVGLLLFSIVSTGCWILLILQFLPYFADSSDYWPGFACAVPAVAAGAITFRAVLGGTILGRRSPTGDGGTSASDPPSILGNDTARPARTPDGP